MPKKQWTDEERKAFGDKMKKARLDKETHGTYPPDSPVGVPEQPIAPENGPGDEPTTKIDQSDDVSKLLRRIEELEAAQWRQSGQPTAQVANGRMTGTVEKYAVAPENYPNPVERLAKESRLGPVAFEFNYDLDFSVSISEYETIDHIRMKEPKFQLELIRVILDEDTGERTTGRYVVCRLIFHEDPEAALVIAKANGVNVDTTDEAHFLNEMRYLTMRDWLLECFYPPRNDQKKKNKREMVIDGKLVDFFEISSEETSQIPFGQLNKKL